MVRLGTSSWVLEAGMYEAELVAHGEKAAKHHARAIYPRPRFGPAKRMI
jgi:hypothetical protein